MTSEYPQDRSCARCGSRMVIVSALAAIVCAVCIDEILATLDARTRPPEAAPA